MLRAHPARQGLCEPGKDVNGEDPSEQLSIGSKTDEPGTAKQRNITGCIVTEGTAKCLRCRAVRL